MTSRKSNLGYFFDASVARFPDKVAIIDLWGGRERTLTYAQFDERADRIAGLVQSLGVKPGERVGMIVGNRAEFLEIFFGAMRAGAIPVPINTRLARDTLKFILEDAECRAVFVEPGTHADAIAVAQAAPLDHRIALENAPAGWLDYATARDAAPRLAEPPALPENAQAFQPYTSGSTGLPKGAIMTHAGMLWYVGYNQEHWPTQPEDRGMIALPLFHKNAMRGTVKPMLYAGGSFVLMPGYDPRTYLEALAKYRCTYSRGVAAVFTMFLQHREKLAQLDLSALKAFTIGSAVVTPELMDEVERTIPGVKVGESYGLTEGGSPFREPLDGRRTPRGSPGVQAPVYQVRLVDEERPRPRRRRRTLAQVAVQLPRLSQAPRHHARAPRRRLAAHRRRLPQGRGGLLLLQVARGRHVLLRRREHLSQGSRGPALPAPCGGECGGVTGAARGEGLRPRGDGGAEQGRRRDGRGDQDLLPGERPEVFAPAAGGDRRRARAAAERRGQDRPARGARVAHRKGERREPAGRGLGPVSDKGGHSSPFEPRRRGTPLGVIRS